MILDEHAKASEQINALQQTPPGSKSQPASDWKRRGRIYSVNDFLPSKL